MRTETHNKLLLNGQGPYQLSEKAVPVIDHLVPGAGTYDPDEHVPIPNFKISQPQP